MTCGYLCPQCEGKGFLEDGSPCDWCTPAEKPATQTPVTETIRIEPISDAEWMRETHEGKCCADE